MQTTTDEVHKLKYSLQDPLYVKTTLIPSELLPFNVTIQLAVS